MPALLNQSSYPSDDLIKYFQETYIVPQRDVNPRNETETGTLEYMPRVSKLVYDLDGTPVAGSLLATLNGSVMKDIIHARIFLPKQEGTFARIVAHLLAENNQEKLTVRAIAAWFERADHDKMTFEPGSTRGLKKMSMTPEHLWRESDEEYKTITIREKLDSGWEKWLSYFENGPNQKQSALRAIMERGGEVYDMKLERDRELWEYLTC